MPIEVMKYLPILFFLGIGLGITSLVVIASLLIAPQRPDPNKNAPYECGFEMATEPSKRFHIRFYLVAILFVIFDIEVIFLYPWAVALGSIGKFGFWSMMVFLAIVTLGFVYEWKKGALEWY